MARVSAAFSASAAAASFAFFSSAAAFAASSMGGGGGSLATATPKVSTTSPAVVRARSVVFIRFLVRSGDAYVRRSRRHFLEAFLLLRHDLAIPDLVMLARPALVDVAVAHRRVGAAHADRAEIDVRR